jgi:sugar O-acyltransferase (sialic acid O-acetyltransferase NeuD family)
MDKILIIGSGEHARMIVELIHEQKKYQIAGFVTDKRKKLGKIIYGYKIICYEKNLKLFLKKNKGIRYYALGIGDSNGMKFREDLQKKYDKILEPATIISPNAIISKFAKIGKGTIVEAFSKIMNGAKIGKHCMIESFTAINHDQVIGNNTFIGNNVSLACTKIGANCIIGDGSTIGFKVKIGSNCIINQGTMISKDLKNNFIAYGQPASFFRIKPKLQKLFRKK